MWACRVIVAHNQALRMGTQNVTGRGPVLSTLQVAPVLSYLLLATNAAVYGTLVQISYSQGPDAAADLIAALGFHPATHAAAAAAAPGGALELWRLATACCLHEELLPLAVAAYGLVAVAPRVEAQMG